MMDAGVKQVLDGFKMGLAAQVAAASDDAALDSLRAVVARMEEIAAEAGIDLVAFQARLQAEDLMGKYAAEMASLASRPPAAGAAGPSAAVDVGTVDITDLEVVTAPHRRVYEATVKGRAGMPRAQEAYERLFALARECRTIPEFNRRAEGSGLFAALGLAATWDSNTQTLHKEIEARQADMVTYALNALACTRDRPYPNSIGYHLTGLALANERKLARRWSWAATYYAFAGELAAYIALRHTEEQRQKTANLLAYSVALTGIDVDVADRHPYVRQLMVINDDDLRRDYGPDWLGTMPFTRVAWYMDAALSPQQKKNAMPSAPPPCPHPYRTGPVDGVDVVVEPIPFSSPVDAPYRVKVRIKNRGKERRGLDAATGLRLWVMTEEDVAAYRVPVAVPDALAPGEEVAFDGDLFAWGLPREERLFLVAFTAGVPGVARCDLAVKYADPKTLTPATWANHYLTPFEGGAATEPAFAMPRRPTPPYPFSVQTG